jgi:DNA-binding MarR family transcriptional regulator
MEEKGLIQRKPHPDDGRSVLINLTDYGTEMRNVSKEKVIRFNEVIAKHISEEKINHFYEVTAVINELIQNRKIFNND